MDTPENRQKDIGQHALVQADKQMGILVLVTGKANGKPHWAYASIPPSRYLAFMEAQKNPTGYDLADYATEILKNGWGKEPSEDIRKEMESRKEGAVDHHFEERIKGLTEKAATAITEA